MNSISDRLWEKAGKQGIPLTGALELLPACNLKCRMCYVRLDMSEVNRRGGLLSAEQWLDYVQQARDEGLLYPLLTGGEPFLRKDFFEIYEGISKMGMQTSINTNATLIDQEIAKRLGENIPTRINITLYGASEDTYEKLCGNGAAYEKVLKAVEYLRQAGIPIKFNASITPENVQDLELMMGYAKSLEAPIQVATYMFPPVRRDETKIGENHRLSPKEAALARVKADYLQDNPSWFRGMATHYSRFVPMTDELLNSLESSRRVKMRCRAGRCSFWMDWQGNLGNCGMFTTYKISMKNKTFKDAWKKVLEETENMEYTPLCASCPNYHICHPCVATVHNECGNMKGLPTYLCEMNQASAEYYREFLKKIEEKMERS